MVTIPGLNSETKPPVINIDLDKEPIKRDNECVEFIDTFFRRHHDKQRSKKLFCIYCDKLFTRSNNLKKHYMIHLKVRPFVCRYCKKTFNKGWNLKQHLISHSTRRNYQCHICSKEFKLMHHLKRHLVKIHNERDDSSSA